MLDLPLDSMTMAEKMQVLETVWDSLCRQPAELNSPQWHGDELEERQRRLESGEATIVPWEEAKARLNQLEP